MNRVVIGMGSNINPHENIEKAKVIISQNHSFLTESKFVETEPIGFTDQPNFINGSILIETEMDYDEFDQWLHELETKLGRIRTENKYGPRAIDLDIVVWNGKVVDDDVYQRVFLKQSVLEILPELII